MSQTMTPSRTLSVEINVMTRRSSRAAASGDSETRRTAPSHHPPAARVKSDAGAVSWGNKMTSPNRRGVRQQHRDTVDAYPLARRRLGKPYSRERT